MADNMVSFVEVMNIMSRLSQKELDELMDSEVKFNTSTTISGLMLIATGLRIYAETDAREESDTHMRLLEMADEHDDILYKAIKKAYKKLNKEDDSWKFMD